MVRDVSRHDWGIDTSQIRRVGDDDIEATPIIRGLEGIPGKNLHPGIGKVPMSPHQGSLVELDRADTSSWYLAGNRECDGAGARTQINDARSRSRHDETPCLVDGAFGHQFGFQPRNEDSWAHVQAQTAEPGMTDDVLSRFPGSTSLHHLVEPILIMRAHTRHEDEFGRLDVKGLAQQHPCVSSWGLDTSAGQLPGGSCQEK